MANKRDIIIRPQPGPQTQFLASRADITFYGGAAFGGKSFGLLLDPLRHLGVSRFKGTVFRRHTTELLMPGGLFPKAKELYMPSGGQFRSGAGQLEGFFEKQNWLLAFKHLQHLDTMYGYHGLETDWMGFDEAQQFYKQQFSYMITRARSTSGIIPRVLATMNPDPDSWVKEMILWYLDAEGRFADYSKSGVIRYFITDPETDAFLWFNSLEEIARDWGPDFADDAMSFTFIPAKLDDNQIGLARDPRYKARLAMQDRVTRARLRDGDWLIKAAAGTYFKRQDFEEIEALPELTRIVRFYDRAATKKTPQNDPDFTCSVKMGVTKDNQFIILDLTDEQESAHIVERGVKNRALQDGTRCKIMSYQDPGSAGKGEAERFRRMLSAFSVATIAASIGKETNCKSFSAASEGGNVKVFAGIARKHKERFYSQLEQFPEGGHDDYVDAGSGAYNALQTGRGPRIG